MDTNDKPLVQQLDEIREYTDEAHSVIGRINRGIRKGSVSYHTELFEELITETVRLIDQRNEFALILDKLIPSMQVIISDWREDNADNYEHDVREKCRYCDEKDGAHEYYCPVTVFREVLGYDQIPQPVTSKNVYAVDYLIGMTGSLQVVAVDPDDVHEKVKKMTLEHLVNWSSGTLNPVYAKVTYLREASE